jgi:hypothetical protein
VKFLDALNQVAETEYETAVNQTGGGWFDGACWHLATAICDSMRLNGFNAALCHVSRSPYVPDHAVVAYRDRTFSESVYIDADGIQTQRQLCDKMQIDGGAGDWKVYHDARWLTPEIQNSALVARLNQAFHDLLKPTFYHVTPKDNLASILRDGLVPAIGPRSVELGETKEAVYAFPDRAFCETALSTWLGDVFDGMADDGLVILAIDSPQCPCKSDAGFEVLYTEPVAPAYLTVLGEDFKPLPEHLNRIDDPLALVNADPIAMQTHQADHTHG